ncbi:hypothetical protein AB1N83_004154 [Pleurotus pulmonarius]|nr:hypothetical protein EYR36_001288 [Pleurotus pulmonarius]
MVWVSNRSPQTIKVTITNTTGGEGATFDIPPNPLLASEPPSTAHPLKDILEAQFARARISSGRDDLPNPLYVETWGQNHWSRKGTENATVVLEESGIEFQTAVGPLDVLLVYSDTYIVQSSTKQEWFS